MRSIWYSGCISYQSKDLVYSRGKYAIWLEVISVSETQIDKKYNNLPPPPSLDGMKVDFRLLYPPSISSGFSDISLALV